MSAYENMVEQRDSNQSEKSEKAWTKSEELTAPGNGAWVLKPNGTTGMGVTLKITGGGSGKVQATTDSLADIIAGNETAVDWPLGTVSGTEQDQVIQVTAVRQVNVSGTTKIIVRSD